MSIKAGFGKYKGPNGTKTAKNNSGGTKASFGGAKSGPKGTKGYSGGGGKKGK